MEEIIFSNNKNKDYIKYNTKKGKFKRITKGIYILNRSDFNQIIKRNIFNILSYLFPESILSDSSAIIVGANHNKIFLRYKNIKKKIIIGDYEILISKEYNFSPNHKLIGNLRLNIASLEFSILQNLIDPKFEKDRIVSSEILINHIKKNLNNINLEEIEKISKKNKLELAKIRFFEIYGKLKGTKKVKKNDNLILKFKDKDIDLGRINMLKTLKIKLENSYGRGSNKFNTFNTFGDSYLNFCFYDSYFSNYIEGTKLEESEAKEIIETRDTSKRPKDSHSILDHYLFIKNFYKNIQNSKEIVKKEEFLSFLKKIHYGITKNTLNSSGNFKKYANMSGSGYSFVLPDKLNPTLEEGFIIGKSIKSPFLKAIYFQFLISETHPFEDGNGRTSRIVLNYFLLQNGLHPMIVTTKYRYAYLRALSEISLQINPNYYLNFFENLNQRMLNTNFENNRLFQSEKNDDDSNGNLFDFLVGEENLNK